jgi:hypothetical protein
VVSPAPRGPCEASNRSVGKWSAGGQGIFQRFKRCHDAIAQRLEPGARLVLALFDQAIIHRFAGSIAFDAECHKTARLLIH